jgi:flavorubredoxin
MSDLYTTTPLETPRLPRELAPGLTWISACTAMTHEGQGLHSYHSVYVLSGERASLIVDTGNPKDWVVIDRLLDEVLDSRPPVRYLVPTHTEVPHCGSLGRLMDKFPEAEVVGDVRDYHLFFPGCERRLRQARVGDVLDLTGRSFEFVEAVIRDLPTTLWGYDAVQQVLFTADGFAYMHHHQADECGLVAEEMPELPLGEFSAVFNQYALYWTRYTDIRPHLERLDALLRRRPARLIAPGHGSVITDPSRTVELIKAGLLEASLSRGQRGP